MARRRCPRAPSGMHGASPQPSLAAGHPRAVRRSRNADGAFRRAEDLAAHEERALLARALDVLAGPGDAATHVAEILALVARVVGARRAAIVTDRPTRRVLVSAEPGEETADALELAAWLDARAARPAAVRAAAAPAEVAVVRARRESGRDRARRRRPARWSSGSSASTSPGRRSSSAWSS